MIVYTFILFPMSVNVFFFVLSVCAPFLCAISAKLARDLHDSTARGQLPGCYDFTKGK
jgi:hypothetical protein